MNTIKLELDFSDDAKAFLCQLMGFKEVKKEPEPEKQKKEKLAKVVDTPKEEKKSSLTLEVVRATANEISQSGKREKVIKLIADFGAGSLKELKESDFESFMEKLKVL